MAAHNENKRLICPHCLKRFDTPQGVKAHQKAKRHTQFHSVEVPWAKYAKAMSASGQDQNGLGAQPASAVRKDLHHD